MLTYKAGIHRGPRFGRRSVQVGPGPHSVLSPGTGAEAPSESHAWGQVGHPAG